MIQCTSEYASANGNVNFLDLLLMTIIGVALDQTFHFLHIRCNIDKHAETEYMFLSHVQGDRGTMAYTSVVPRPLAIDGRRINRAGGSRRKIFSYKGSAAFQRMYDSQRP